MFCSSNVTDCPVPLSELSSTRQTYRDYDKFVGFEIALTLGNSEIQRCSQICSYEDQIAFLASAAKKQRAEVKEKHLSETDRQLLLGAKQKNRHGCPLKQFAG